MNGDDGKANIERASNTILMSSKSTRTITSRLRYKFACLSGYCPTSKEIQNNEIKKMASRLKSNSDEETLTNVLAWQNGRISYWYERWNLPITIPLSLAFSWLFFSLASFFNPLMCLWFSAFFVGFAVAVFVTLFLLFGSRKIPILSSLDSSFAGSISMDFLLKNRLAICRDYAKLTACLLSNIYPDQEIYFASARQHVATGIMVGGRLYVLDKWLPVATIDKWRERWKSKKQLKRFKGNCLESVSMNSFLSNIKPSKLDREKLATDMAKLLNITEQTSNDNLSSLEILHWRKGFKLYEDDKIVNYSLSKLIEKNILDERVDLSQITKLEVIQDKDDLIFCIKFKLNK